jgi:hypothetical protein
MRERNAAHVARRCSSFGYRLHAVVRGELPPEFVSFEVLARQTVSARAQRAHDLLVVTLLLFSFAMLDAGLDTRLASTLPTTFERLKNARPRHLFHAVGSSAGLLCALG